MSLGELFLVALLALIFIPSKDWPYLMEQWRRFRAWLTSQLTSLGPFHD